MSSPYENVCHTMSSIDQILVDLYLDVFSFDEKYFGFKMLFDEVSKFY